MKLFELFATIRLDDKEFTDGVKRSTAAGKQLGSSMEGVSVKAVALGTALYNAGVQAAKMAGSLVKSSIEAAATVQAETAQFNSAFGEMAGVATKALKNVEGETGILYTRLRSVGTKAFSQLKGAGLGAADAMSAMEEYTTLAADAAAYYDISLEEADAKLRSFMRGNTEAGDAIGLFTSEAQRNERAVEKYGKKWTELAESQKQLLMLDITRSIYEQSGAIGQAAKEADSWANVMGNMRSAWTNAIAAFGAPIQASVTPAIQGIIDKLNSEDTKLVLEQFGLKIADGITALYDGEDSPIKQTIKFVGDVADAFSSDTGSSVLTAVGAVGGAIFAWSHPLLTVIALTGTLIANWENVKNAIDKAVQSVGNWAMRVREALGITTTGDPDNPNNPYGNNYHGSGAPKGSTTFEIGEITHGGGGEGRGFGDVPIETVYNAPSNEDNEVSYGDFFSNAKGLPYVPYDNYLTLLHRGEQVVQANRATQNRTGSADISGLYGAILAAVREGVSNIAVNMDGKKVGTIVSRHQSAQIDNDIRSGRYSLA